MWHVSKGLGYGWLPDREIHNTVQHPTITLFFYSPIFVSDTLTSQRRIHVAGGDEGDDSTVSYGLH